ncbi:IclR family transcriptional regulator C-terminal domain-containing protein [Variovorax sp. J22P168]|uniref:IclR family transcriptional regulator domain-containing protein n=1 Tax=Variovorax jilinensis TaxID=3053513 RepID=UPI002575A00C|nr:IclR family transcriptional regulator C-terminal domain-containing protein [Variovorax sp. J22P168]MDM0013880.1 IclR family transcriptional regulator C-terminal domain-containing protein [Variovorax sp. J22P168]
MLPTPESPPIDRKLLIEGLGKGLRVIEAFSEDRPRLTATEAGERAALTRTAARRYLLSLVHYGYAATDGKYYWLLPRVLRLGQAFMEVARVPRIAQPFIQRASMQCGETLNVGTLDGHEVVYLSRSNAPRVVSIGFHPGARVPAHVVSQGPALLSTFDDAALEAWLEAHDFAAFTGFTVADPDRFRDNVLAARRLGYAHTDQGLDFGLSGLALPLKDRKGQCQYALSVTVQRQVYPDTQLVDRLLPVLREAAEALRPII